MSELRGSRLRLKDPKEASALWGKLVCDSSMGYWDAALADVKALRVELGETTTVARSWLLHFSLFTYFKRVGATQVFLDHVIDFGTYAYANTIEVAAPHLCRYLAVAAILNRKKRSFLKRVMKIIEQEQYRYSDVFTEFLIAMVECDFPKANERIKGFAAEIEEDFFLVDFKDEVLDSNINYWQVKRVSEKQTLIYCVT
jgi:translation initiation factor 3 subunit E